MDNYKEIVTKAIISKAKKGSVDKININIDNSASTILGCWIINHNFNGSINNNDVNISGKYDINVWYSYDNDSKTSVVKETYNYLDNININLNDKSSKEEVIVRSLKQPTVKSVKLNNNSINLEIEKELAIEVVGDTKIKVPTTIIDDDYIDLTANSSIDDIDKVDNNYIK